jgi:hypothetical protein
MFMVLSHQTYCVLVGANCRILKNPNCGNEMEGLSMNTKVEIILLKLAAHQEVK